MDRGYHSFAKAGTEYTPQWKYMPNLASLNHSGTGFEFSSDSNVDWKYCPGVCDEILPNITVIDRNRRNAFLDFIIINSFDLKEQIIF
jgi:hypothetical protein